MIDTIVYLLCMATALMCAVLLFRGYHRTRTPLLLWSGLCFAVLTLDNLMLCIDRLVIPDSDLALIRAPISLVGVLLLLYGIIWKTNT